MNSHNVGLDTYLTTVGISANTAIHDLPRVSLDDEDFAAIREQDRHRLR